MDRDEDSRTPAEEPAVSEPTDLPEHSGSRWEPRADDDGPAEAAAMSATPGADLGAGAAPSRRRVGRVAAVAGAAVVLAGAGFGAGFAVGHSGPDGGPEGGPGVGHHRGHDGGGGPTAPGQTGQTGQSGQPTSAGPSAILGGLFT